jgi:ABC-type lipoprotein export system ATPase subunit
MRDLPGEASTGAAATAAFDLVEVGKTFEGGGGVAIDRLIIPAGKVVAVLGLSGTGKSTLLGMLGGIVPVGHGLPRPGMPTASTRPELKVRLLRGGVPVHIDLVAENGRGRFDEFGFVFQNAHLLRNAMGVMNITAAFTASGITRPLGDLLDQAAAVNLTPELLVKRARQLSGGEKQRTAIGRGIARHPQILFADEPTANLDPRNGLSIMGQICRWQRLGKGERTVIWVTHNILEVSVFADEIILLEPPPPGLSDKVGRLMRPKSGWKLPSLAADDAAAETLWPMPNPHDPRTLVSMLFGADLLSSPSEQSAELLKSIRSHFVECNKDAPAIDVELLSAAIAMSAIGIGSRAREPASMGEPSRNVSEHVPKIQLTPRELDIARATHVGSWSVLRIGIGELFSKSRADSGAKDVPRPVSRLIGLPNALVDIAINRKVVGTRQPASNAFLALLGLLGIAALLSARYWQLEPSWAMPAFGISIVSLACLRLARHSAINLFWIFRAYERRFQSTILLAIAVFLYALVLARDAVRSSFDASLRSLELSHVVVALRSSGGNLDQKKIEEHDDRLKTHIAPAAAELDNSWQKRWLYEPSIALGYWLTHAFRRIERRYLPPPTSSLSAAVLEGPAEGDARLVFGRWLMQKQVIQWPLVELVKPEDLSLARACLPREGAPPPTRFSDADILSIDTAEPAMEQLRYLKGTALSDLAPVAKAPPADAMRRAMDPDDKDNLMGVIVSRQLIERLHAARPPVGGAQASRAIPLAKHLCMFGPEEGRWQLVRVVGIVDALPKEQLVDAVHVMIPHAMFEHVYKRKVGETSGLPGYNSEAIYFKDPRLVSTYKKFLELRQEEGTVLPDAFNQIQKGLETSKSLTDLVSYILFGVVGFAMLLVGLLTSSFITENEQSLCVLRAFGVRLRHIVWLVGLQMFIIWGAALIFAFAIVWLLAPRLETAMIEQMGLTAHGLRGTLSGWYEMIAMMTLSILLASGISSASWWFSTPNVGDRLKELD